MCMYTAVFIRFSFIKVVLMIIRYYLYFVYMFEYFPLFLNSSSLDSNIK